MHEIEVCESEKGGEAPYHALIFVSRGIETVRQLCILTQLPCYQMNAELKAIC